jgi:hypothetical protein
MKSNLVSNQISSKIVLKLMKTGDLKNPNNQSQNPITGSTQNLKKREGGR